jgi:hypothetical protein
MDDAVRAQGDGAAETCRVGVGGFQIAGDTSEPSRRGRAEHNGAILEQLATGLRAVEIRGQIAGRKPPGPRWFPSHRANAAACRLASPRGSQRPAR